MEFIQRLHNFQILLLLKRYKLFVGPVENSTRSVYLRRLTVYYNKYPQMINDSFQFLHSLANMKN